jgi:hypothetical protein
MAIAAHAASVPFSRYEVILARKPFGEPPAPPTPVASGATVPAQPPAPSFVKELRLCGLTQSPRWGITAGVVDIRTQKSYLLRVGETDDEIEMVDADFDAGAVKLRKGADTQWLYLEGSEGANTRAGMATSSGTPTTPVGSGTPQSYADRLRARRETSKVPKVREVAAPKLTGEELEKYLQQYQMDVIRRGDPALPVPLTPEMDQQLVKEGFLEP